MYLARFANDQMFRASTVESGESSFKQHASVVDKKSLSGGVSKKSFKETKQELNFPASISVSELIQAGILIKPKPKKKITVTLEMFDVKCGTWIDYDTLELQVHTEKFSSEGFRDAFLATSSNPQDKRKWVMKSYNDAARKTITEIKTTEENHARKQVQMHIAARNLAQRFSTVVPVEFGESFQYNMVYYINYEDKAASIEEYVDGNFVKYVNNTGKVCNISDSYKELSEKAQCLVHHSYSWSQRRLMLLDIQGSGSTLYDPEIATATILSKEDEELLFCCGNLSAIAIKTFVNSHKCNKFCEMIGLPELDETD